MTCISEGTLRAYRDAELEGQELLEVREHLEKCPDCRQRSEELAAVASRVHERLSALAGVAEGSPVNAQVALSRFKAQHESNAQANSSVTALLSRRWRPLWVTAFAAALVIVCLTFPSARGLAQRFLQTLRVEKIQPIAVDTSIVEGNDTLRQRLGQMISDKVVVTVREKMQPEVGSAETASELAGFKVQLLGARTDTPELTVLGQHSFHMTMDVARLQDVFDQAGRSDLRVPASADGATIAVQIPRGVLARYGNCPTPRREKEERRSEPSEYKNCLHLLEVPSPMVSVPSGLDIAPLAETALQLAGMSPSQAKEFCRTVNWKSTLVLPLPHFMQSYELVDVNGAQGTLISHLAGRPGGGANYTLVWVRNGMIYSLVGFGNPGEAVALANSIS
jgi:hypothetical protein